MKDNKSVLTKIRGYFLTGIIVTAPVGLTFYVSFLFIGFIAVSYTHLTLPTKA